MAPAVCILNPLYGTHNCRPGGGPLEDYAGFNSNRQHTTRAVALAPMTTIFRTHPKAQICRPLFLTRSMACIHSNSILEILWTDSQQRYIKSVASSCEADIAKSSRGSNSKISNAIQTQPQQRNPVDASIKT